MDVGPDAPGGFYFMETRFCKKCEKDLPISEFYQKLDKRDGRTYWESRCKQCCIDYQMDKLRHPENYPKKERSSLSKLEQRRIYRANNRDKFRKSRNKHYQTKGKQVMSEQIVIENFHLTKGRATYIMKAYGLTPERYKELYDQQEGRCPICTMTLSLNNKDRNRIHIDHCHATGKVRGLLCHSCNTGIGYLCDNTDSLQRGIEYLIRTKDM